MPTVYLCRGSDCRKQKLKRGVLLAFTGDCPVVTVDCQKVCKAPVVGVDFGAGPRWFKKMDSEAALSALSVYLRTGQLPAPLAEREKTKRAGRLRE